jgi:hypothetical protein
LTWQVLSDRLRRLVKAVAGKSRPPVDRRREGRLGAASLGAVNLDQRRASVSKGLEHSTLHVYERCSRYARYVNTVQGIFEHRSHNFVNQPCQKLPNAAYS